jgi:prefoldin subunit 5
MVTSTQAIAARPIQNQIDALTAAIAELTAANNTNGLASCKLVLTDANGNTGAGEIDMTIPLTVAEAAPMIQAMIAQLNTLLAALQAALAAI